MIEDNFFSEGYLQCHKICSINSPAGFSAIFNVRNFFSHGVKLSPLGTAAIVYSSPR
jgi:hypothetical protein